jgi:hypothetical protein
VGVAHSLSRVCSPILVAAVINVFLLRTPRDEFGDQFRGVLCFGSQEMNNYTSVFETVCKTVREIGLTLNEFVGSEGNSYNGAHYRRPDDTRGPIIAYQLGRLRLAFSVDRAEAKGWKVSNAWLIGDSYEVYALPKDIIEDIAVSTCCF